MLRKTTVALTEVATILDGWVQARMRYR